LTNKERLEAIKANWIDIFEASRDSPHYEGPWLDDDDVDWLISRAQRAEELETELTIRHPMIKVEGTVS